MKNKNKYPFLKIGYASFPLRDVGKEFEVVDTIDMCIKKPRFMGLRKGNKYMQLHINYREIEGAVWEEIKKGYKELFKEADWLVISMISGFGDELKVSLDVLKKVNKPKKRISNHDNKKGQKT